MLHIEIVMLLIVN